MKKPIKPRKPHKPIKPSKTLDREHYVMDIHDNESFADIIKKAREKYGPNVQYENLVINFDQYYDTADCTIGYVGSIENENYEKDVLAYNKKKKQYDKKIIVYADKLKLYEKSHQEWLDFKNKQEKDKKEKLFRELKEELGKW